MFDYMLKESIAPWKLNLHSLISEYIMVKIYERVKVDDRNRFKFFKKISRGCHLLDPRWNGLFSIICQKDCFLAPRWSCTKKLRWPLIENSRLCIYMKGVCFENLISYILYIDKRSLSFLVAIEFCYCFSIIQ